MDRNKLAILTNQLGGYDEVERVIGVDQELVQRAVEGQQLTSIQQAEIETGFNQLYLDKELALDNGIDINAIESLSKDLSDTVNFFYDQDAENRFRQGVADGVVDANDLADGGTLFANLTSSQIDKVLSLLETDEASDEISNLFSFYLQDYYSEVDFWDVQDSLFWEWFRETFYGDD